MYSNKTILITGTSRGIGKEIALYFLKHNGTVIGLSKSNATIQNDNYFHYNVDLSNSDNLISCFKNISKQFKILDIVINNASVLTSQYSMIMPIQDAINMINTNILGTFIVSREAAKLMRKSPYGRIINIGSMAASLEPIGDSVYAASKSAINTLANVMAKEFGPKITCNTLGITAIETDMLKQLPRDKIDAIVNNLAIPRYAEYEDIFNVIEFFASEKSSYITAQVIYLGGIN